MRPSLLAGAVVVTALGCGGEAGMVGVNEEWAPLAELVASDVSPRTLSPAMDAVRSESAAGDVTWVSLPFGTIPAGTRARIHSSRAATEVAAQLVSGGFDPVPIEAVAGDTIFVEVSVGEDESERYFQLVPIFHRPVVVRTSPPPGKRDVPLNSRVAIVFSEPLDAAALAEGISLAGPSGAVAGTLAFVDPNRLIVRFEPAEPLAASTTYRLTVPAGIRDANGQTLASDFLADYVTAADGAPAPVTVPDGDLAFSSNRDGDFLPFVMRADGTGLQVIPGLGNNDYPADWSHDGSRLMYWSGQTGTIYITNPDGSPPIQLNAGLGDFLPRFSPDDSHIVFTRFFPGTGGPDDANYEVMVMRADGSDLRRLTDTPGFESDPDWSPDGARIVFSSDRDPADPGMDLYVMNADGSGVTRLTRDAGHAVSPVWSPDGRRIAFSSGVDLQHSLYLINPDGSGRVRLTDGGDQYDGEPTWSPDGRQLAFVRRLGRSTLAIGVVNVDGTGLRLITSGPAWNEMPVWRPARTVP